MTRAAEFCYIAEHRDGAFLMGLDITERRVFYTEDPEGAMRITAGGRKAISDVLLQFGFGATGFRKILAG